MKSAKILFSILVLLASSSFAQTLNDYVLETRGDTLVVKDDADFGADNTLYSLMNADTLNVPAGRVYLLHNKGIYSLVNGPTSSSKQKTIVMGETQTSLKINKGDAPPIIQGSTYQGGNSTPSMTSGYDLLVKNIDLELGNSAGSLGWGFFNASAGGVRVQVDNCIMEHSLWIFCGNFPTGTRTFLTNNYFVNLGGYTCRRNGGVIDFFNDQDTISVQNCTHVNIQGSLYKARPGYKINRYLFNHNDFIDCAGFVNMNSGDHPNFSVTNNIYVNCQIQAFAPVLANVDVGEVDPDNLPMGIVNVRDDSAFAATNQSFYVDRNLVYWDPSLADVPTLLNNAKINGASDWVSQMIPMNSRSKAMFDNNTKYPRLVEGTWVQNVLPAFKNPDVLFTSQLAVVKNYAVAAVDTTSTGSLPSYRTPGNPESQYFTYADWPIPIDLSYTNSDLLTAGLNGFPIGDLNWFPTQYAAWKAQENTELAQIQNVLSTGVINAVEVTTGQPQQFQLQQNYPNPFNPSTVITYTIPQAGNVSLKVYNMLGQEVATLVNGYNEAQTYNVNFNASNLASGLYLYTVKYGDQSMTRKMMLLK